MKSTNNHLILLGICILFSASLNGQIYEMDNVNGMTINTCSGTFFDSQALDLVPGSGDYYYNVGENYQVTFCSSIAGSLIRFDFEFLQIASGEDTLWVYDGPSATGTPIAIYSGGYVFESVVGFSGCLTFVFISTGSFVSTGWEADISCFTIPPTPLQPACTNVGFENGNFGGWYGTYGIPSAAIPATAPTAMSTGSPGAPRPNYFPDVYNATLAPYHTITTGAGLDPYGGFPIVSPNGGTNSMRLGDFDNPYYGGASIEQKFSVTAANAMMIYSYAVVIQDAAAGGTPHAPEEQPFFQIEAFDCAGNSIPCGDFLVVGGAAIPGFFLAPGFLDVYYKPWTDVFLDLSPYVGTCVTVRFTQGDCTLGAHYSYVYIDAMCGPLEIIGPQYICPGEFVTLEAPPGGASYSWTPGGQTSQTITVSPAVYTDYTCLVTPVTGPSCTSLLNYWVDVYPPASVTVNSDSICAGDPSTLIANPSSPGGTFLWSPGGQVTPSITVSPAVTTNYIVDFTDANGCTASDTGIVTVSPSPAPVITGTLNYCQGTTTTLSTTLAYSSYLWSTGATTPTVDVTVADNPVSVTVTNAAGCTATAQINVIEDLDVVYNSNEVICQGDSILIHGNWESTAGVYSNTYPIPGGCDSTLNVTLIVNPLPNIFAGNNVVICDGGQIILTASGGTSYVWNNGVSDGVPFTPITGWYTVIGTDANGCENIDSVMVNVEPSPAPTFIVDLPTCEPYTITLTNTTPGNISSCVWLLSNGVTLNGCGPISYTFPTAGIFDVTLTTSSSLGCIASITSVGVVNIETSPNASFSPGSISLTSLNTAVQFNNTSSGASDFMWTFGDGTAGTTIIHPYHVFPDETGEYLITLIAYSTLGCADTAYASVIVYEELLFYVPNTFTPDGDNFNEYFRAIFSSGFDPYDFHLLIFNRWGEIIWESFDDSVGWDGTYNGGIVQDGTYTWKIDFKTTRNDERKLVVGHVNVIR